MTERDTKTVDKLVDALRRLLERDECDDYYHDKCLCKQEPERAAQAALLAYESETRSEG